MNASGGDRAGAAAPSAGPSVAGEARVRARSLQGRLLVATVAAAALALVLAGVALSQLFRRHVEQQFAAGLSRQLDQLSAHVDADAEGRPRVDSDGLNDPRWSQPYSGLYWQMSETGRPAGDASERRSRSLWEARLDAPDDLPADGELHLHRVDGPGGARLLLAERALRVDGAASPPWRVQVAADLHETAAAVRAFDGVLAASLALLLALLAAAAALQVRVGLAPLRALQRSLVDVREGRAQRLPGRFPREVQPLVDDFNAVLARNAEVVARARTQAGDLAHAVKTPLAALAQGAEAARARPQALAELPALVEEQVALARRHVDWHLSRARAAAAQGLPGARAEVAPAVAGLVRVMQRVHAERGVRIEVAPIAPRLAFAGEAQDLQEMVGNLLDNACRWARSVVRVEAARAAEPAAARLRVFVQDDGPGIEAGQRERALARGARLDESTPGHGLGLAIVRDRVALYGGDLTLDDAPGGGLRAVLELPAAAP